MNGYWEVVSSTTPTTPLTSIAAECPETSVNRPLPTPPPDPPDDGDDASDGGGDDDDLNIEIMIIEMMMIKNDYYDIDPGYVNCLPSFTGIGRLIVSSCLRQILSHGFHNINSKPSGSGS